MVVVVSNNGVMLWGYAKTTLSLMVELSRAPPLRGILPLLLLKALLYVILWLFANIQEADLAQIANLSTRWTDRSFGVLCDFVGNPLLRLLLCVLRFRWNEAGVC